MKYYELIEFLERRIKPKEKPLARLIFVLNQKWILLCTNLNHGVAFANYVVSWKRNYKFVMKAPEVKDIASLSHPSCSTPLPCVAVKRLISSLVKLMSVIHCLFFFASEPCRGKTVRRSSKSSAVIVCSSSIFLHTFRKWDFSNLFVKVSKNVHCSPAQRLSLYGSVLILITIAMTKMGRYVSR